jgi:hypothetical protein
MARSSLLGALSSGKSCLASSPLTIGAVSKLAALPAG